MPKQWYNLRADMTNKPAPLLNPGTLQPMTAEELRRRFLRGAGHSRSWTTPPPYIDIPEEIREFYKMYRPSPLVPGLPPGKGPGHPGENLLQI